MRWPPGENDDEYVERHIDTDYDEDSLPRQDGWLPVSESRLVLHCYDTKRHADNHPVLAIDEEVCDQIVRLSVFVGWCAYNKQHCNTPMKDESAF